MEIKVLMVYASTHGSTQEVADVVAATLREYGITVEIQSARNVKTLSGYSAVVLGAPLYMFHMHKDAIQFLARFRQYLTSGLPLAIFAGGPIGEGDEKEWQDVRKQLDQELAKLPWIKPIAIEVIGGRIDPSRLHFPWNLIPALKQIPPRDHRDWEAIHTWASSLASQYFCINVENQPGLS